MPMSKSLSGLREDRRSCGIPFRAPSASCRIPRRERPHHPASAIRSQTKLVRGLSRSGETRAAPERPEFSLTEADRRGSGTVEGDFRQRMGRPGERGVPAARRLVQASESSIRFYSGAATYRNVFRLPRGTSKQVYLELGEVKNLAQVRVNGSDAGIVWTAPWRVDIGKFVRSGDNELEIEVVNLWPNRLIGDGDLPKDQRYTKTNVKTYERQLPPGFSCWWEPECEERKKSGEPAKLLPSGLLGPVVLLSQERG